MTPNPHARWLLTFSASLILSACGGSAAPAGSYEEASEAPPTASAGGEGGGAVSVEAEADFAGADDGMSDSGGEATSVERPTLEAVPGMDPAPSPGRQPVRPTVRPQPIGPRQLGRTGYGSDAYQRLVQASIDLDQATTLARVDCSSARDLRDQICELSTRICEISEEHPDDEPTEERCRDGRARCRGASDRVDQSCP